MSFFRLLIKNLAAKKGSQIDIFLSLFEEKLKVFRFFTQVIEK